MAAISDSPPTMYQGQPIFTSWAEAGDKISPMKMIVHDGWKIRQCTNGWKLMCKAVLSQKKGCATGCSCHLKK